MSDLFGPIVTGHDVEAAMTAHLQAWTPDYLAEVAAQSGRVRGDLEHFRSFVSYVDLSKYNEDQVPTCVVTAPGIIGTPERRYGSQYLAEWGVGVGCVVAGQDEENTWELVGLYTAAVRAAVLQHKSLGGFAEDTFWAGERYDELGSSDARTFMAGIVQFNVQVALVVDAALGPVKPSADATLPPGDWPRVQTTGVTTVSKGS